MMNKSFFYIQSNYKYRILPFMFPNQNTCLTVQLNTQTITNITQPSTQFDQLSQEYSSASSHNSKKQNDGFVSSTDEEQSNCEPIGSLEEVVIYDERFLIDFSDEESIKSFLFTIELKKNITAMTKESIKILVLQKAINSNDEMAPLLTDACEQYENLMMKAIFI